MSSSLPGWGRTKEQHREGPIQRATLSGSVSSSTYPLPSRLRVAQKRTGALRRLADPRGVMQRTPAIARAIHAALELGKPLPFGLEEAPR